jgi:hypothetical protein
MLKNIQKFCCAIVPDAVKMDAGIYSDDQFGRITTGASKTKARDEKKVSTAPAIKLTSN